MLPETQGLLKESPERRVVADRLWWKHESESWIEEFKVYLEDLPARIFFPRS